MDLFANDRTTIRLPMEGADVTYHPRVEFGESPDTLLRRLRDEIPWNQQQTSWGPEPRLTSWHADGGISYTYSGRTLTARPLVGVLEDLRAVVERETGARYNSVLLNQYRDGRDSIGFHADDEPGVGPHIASLSFGAERTFELKPNDRRLSTVKVRLEHGSLLVMAGDTQRNWKHGIRKDATAGLRINLTFRWTDRA